MIRGLGLDVVETDRIAHSLQRFGRRFLQKILSAPEEQALRERGLTCPEEASSRPAPALVSALAARFAAKEAAAKALGTGFARGIGMHDVEIHTLPSGQPELRLHGPAAARMAELGAVCAHVSLTHGRDTAAAVVILEA